MRVEGLSRSIATHFDIRQVPNKHSVQVKGLGFRV